MLELLRSHPTGSLLIQADSVYVIKGFKEWLDQWRKRGMRRANGKPVENQDLIKEIDRLLTGRDIKWEWVKGHAGHDLNNAADHLARQGATAAMRMELAELLELLRLHPTGDLLIQVDNAYMIKVFKEWLGLWRKRNMRKANGKPVENSDLLVEIDDCLTGRDVEWQWVQGTVGGCPHLRVTRRRG